MPGNLRWAWVTATLGAEPLRACFSPSLRLYAIADCCPRLSQFNGFRSVFLGDELGAVVESIIQGTDFQGTSNKELRIGVDVLPSIPKDTSDRNRTSPMAFTGNKFEFRMLGSSQSITGPNIALNTIMAEELEQFANELEAAENFKDCLQSLIRRTFSEHQRIIFNGNGYDKAWIEEAERRGLSNFLSTADALPMYTAKKNVELFVRHGIYTEEEIQARAEIHIESYTSILLLEANTMIDMVRHDILPSASAYGSELSCRLMNKKSLGISHSYEENSVREIGEATDSLFSACEHLESITKEIPSNPTLAMVYCHDKLVPCMEEVRRYADHLELLTATTSWPFPVYTDLLFYV